MIIHRRKGSALVLSIAGPLALASRPAMGQVSGVQGPPGSIPVAFKADEVSFDVQGRAIRAQGNVQVDQPPFHVESDSLTLRRVSAGVELDGHGRVVFCPCFGSPLAVSFDGATLSPPHDLVLRNPVLAIFGIPVAWAPAFWLRSPGRFGILPPDLQWRGTEGLFVGDGIHVPWKDGDLARGLDLRAGGYAEGGVAAEADLRTTGTSTRIRWDRFRAQDGIEVGAYGSTAVDEEAPSSSAAWRIDALRGARAVQAALDADVAAKAFDHADAQANWLLQGWTLASGIRSVALRGGDLADLGVGGPVVMARNAGTLWRAGAFDVTAEGGQVAGDGPAATSFARAEAGALVGSNLGAMGTTLAIRAIGDVADDGTREGTDAGAQLRASAAFPFARAFASGDALDPWLHTTEPRVEVAGIATHSDGVLVATPGRGMEAPSGTAGVASVAWHNAVGRWGSRAGIDADVIAGVVVEEASPMRPVLRARAAYTGPWAGIRADYARVVLPLAEAGGALVAAGRLGTVSGPNLSVHVAQRDGIDPVLARLLADAPLEPASGFLASPGWTGGARLGVPLGSRATIRGGTDVDFDAREIVAAIGSLELHDPCGCVVLRATASHRIGRGGVDGWVALDLPR